MIRLSKQLAKSSRNVSCWYTHDHIEQENRGKKCAPIRWREKAESCKQEGEESHNQQLSSSSRIHGQEMRKRRRSENIAVNKFPSGFFTHFLGCLSSFFFGSGHFIVPCEIFTENTCHDQSHYSRQKYENYEGIHNTEPMDLVIHHLTELQIYIPPRGPFNIAALPFNIVSENNISTILGVQDHRFVCFKKTSGLRSPSARCQHVIRNRRFIPFAFESMLDRKWNNLISYNVISSIRSCWIRVFVAVHWVVKNLEP
mmetsp:Transcript_14113/g.30125  ORF Transcript_14113/g.30125 Transcript_14113/m.30125 type:complete len:256 (+) Transcript_14113:1011-1778(+)